MAQPSDFPLLWTDGDQSHLPTDKEKDSGYKSSDAYGLSQKALINFATEMQKQLGRKADAGKSEQHRSFVTAPPISKNSCYIFLYLLYDRSPRIEFPVFCMCDRGPCLLVVVAQAAASRLGEACSSQSRLSLPLGSLFVLQIYACWKCCPSSSSPISSPR
ncbi:hypothetical protein BDR22DRAFT_828888 [Usnea florida]